MQLSISPHFKIQHCNLNREMSELYQNTPGFEKLNLIAVFSAAAYLLDLFEQNQRKICDLCEVGLCHLIPPGLTSSNFLNQSWVTRRLSFILCSFFVFDVEPKRRVISEFVMRAVIPAESKKINNVRQLPLSESCGSTAQVFSSSVAELYLWESEWHPLLTFHCRPWVEKAKGGIGTGSSPNLNSHLSSPISQPFSLSAQGQKCWMKTKGQQTGVGVTEWCSNSASIKVKTLGYGWGKQQFQYCPRIWSGYSKPCGALGGATLVLTGHILNKISTVCWDTLTLLDPAQSCSFTLLLIFLVIFSLIPLVVMWRHDSLYRQLFSPILRAAQRSSSCPY